MAMSLVVDSNMLQSPVLRDFLTASACNIAVLPDYVWFEVCKTQSLAGLSAAFSVIGDFPDQVTVLRSWAEVAKIDAMCPELVDRMQVENMPAGVRLMAGELAALGGDEAAVSGALRERWAGAAWQAADMLLGADDIAVSLPEIAEIFTSAEIRICRVNGRYTDEMFAKIYGVADQHYEGSTERYGAVIRPPRSQARYDSYLYRQGLVTMIYALWWIRGGSRPPKRLDRVRNDIIDMQFAVYGTYFSGLLTEDQKAGWLYENLRRALKSAYDVNELPWTAPPDPWWDE